MTKWNWPFSRKNTTSSSSSSSIPVESLKERSGRPSPTRLKRFKWPSKITTTVHALLDLPIHDTHVYTLLSTLEGLLQYTDYLFKSERALSSAKRTLLALWTHTLRLIEKQKNTQVHEICFRIILSIVDRNEFSLRDLPTLPRGVTQNERGRKLSFHSSDTEIEGYRDDDTAEGVARKYLHTYRRLLVETVQCTLQTLSSLSRFPTTTSPQGRFHARILGVAYIRVPYFQKQLQDLVEKVITDRSWPALPKSKESESHWSGNTFEQCLTAFDAQQGYLTEQQKRDSQWEDIAEPVGALPKSKCTKNTLRCIENNVDLYEWTQFVPYLDTIPDEEVFAEINQLLPILITNAEFFFFFVTELVQQIKRTVLAEPSISEPGPFVWSTIPGYGLLLHTCTLLLREACWRQWWELTGEMKATTEPPVLGTTTLPTTLLLTSRGVRTVMQTSAHLLSNHDLLDVFLLALFESTNLYESKSVGLTLHHLEKWLLVVVSDEINGHLPSSFCGSNTLALGLLPMLRTDSFDILKKVLLFLYHRLDLFSHDLRQEILKTLLSRHFTLFLHWHVEVRTFYHHILVYRICKVPRHVLDSFTDTLLLPESVSTNESEASMSDQYKLLTLYTERAHWRAFDACVSLTCQRERGRAREALSFVTQQRAAAANRQRAMRRLSVEIPEFIEIMDYCRPSVLATSEMEMTPKDIRPPYYLRHLPQKDEEALRELTELLSVGYPTSLQVYAGPSLSSYIDLLRKYYDAAKRGVVECPALGFC